MKVLTVHAHPDPESSCHAVLEEFTAGLCDAGGGPAAAADGLAQLTGATAIAAPR